MADLRDFRWVASERKVVELTDAFRERYLDRLGLAGASPEEQFWAALVDDLAGNDLPVEVLDGLDLPGDVFGFDCFAGLVAFRAVEQEPAVALVHGEGCRQPEGPCFSTCGYRPVPGLRRGVGEMVGRLAQENARLARDAVFFACWVCMGPEEGERERPREAVPVTPDARRWVAV